MLSAKYIGNPNVSWNISFYCEDNQSTAIQSVTSNSCLHRNVCENLGNSFTHDLKVTLQVYDSIVRFFRFTFQQRRTPGESSEFTYNEDKFHPRPAQIDT